MAKQKVSKELAQFQEAANNLIAIRILQEYLHIREFGPSELENFVECWVKSHVLKPTAKMKKSIWRYFLTHWKMYLQECKHV